jgi:hypothetical protein
MKLPLAVTWKELVAEQVTVCAVALSGETENVEPDAGAQFGVIGPSTGSIAVAVYVTAVPARLAASTVVSPGSCNVGGRAVTVVAALVTDSVVGNSV